MHEDPPLYYGFEAPAVWSEIPEAERPERGLLSGDQCIIDNVHFFLVGNLELPVVGSEERFSRDVRVSLSERSFDRACELWEQPGREAKPPYFAWVSSGVLGYPETLNLKAMVHTRAVGVRPLVELEPTDHPLAVEQRTGISRVRVQEIAELFLHGGFGGRTGP